MALHEMISKRKSCRSYTGVPVEAAVLEKIKTFPMKPLYPDIKVHWEIVERKQVKCICPWTTPQLIAIYSEKKEGYLENAGFLFQQMDLYLQSLGLGACWLGMGKMHGKTAPDVPGMQFVILLAFGNPEGEHLRPDGTGFKRKSLEEIADSLDAHLEPARLAPSSVNSQPWYFIHEEDTIHVYCAKNSMLAYMNRIDMGITLAHLYLTHVQSFQFFPCENPPAVQNHDYIGSIHL